MRSIPFIPTQRGEAKEEVSILWLLQLLWREKWRIAIYMFIAILLGGYYAFRMTTPIYTATTQIALLNQKEQIVDFDSPLTPGFDFLTIVTEQSAMKARRLMEKVVVKLDLEANPDFNPTLREAEPSMIGNLISSALSVVRDPTDQETRVRAYSDREIRERIIDKVISSVTVRNLAKSYVFDITAHSTSAEMAASLADTVAELYIQEQIAVKYEATERATKWLSERVGELKEELDITENKVKTFNSSTNLVGPEALAALNRQLKEFRSRITDTNTRIVTIEAQIQTMIMARDSGDPQRMAAAAEDTGLTQLVPRLTSDAARQAFDARFDQLLERTQFELERAKAQVPALENSVAELEQRVSSQSADLLTLEQLEREAEASRQIYEYFLNRLKETSVQQGVHRADSRVYSYAVIPVGPSRPRKMMIIMLSALFGCIIGSTLVILREMSYTGFRSSEEIEEATGVNVLAQLPKAPHSRRRRILRYLSTKPTSALVEAVRNLRTSILLSNIDNPPQVIMLTSSLPAEGKTTLALAMAQSFSGVGKKTLLIEGDIRRRTFQEYFDRKVTQGVVSAAAGEVQVRDVVFKNEDMGDCDILLGEKSTINAADFFSSARFANLLEQMRSEYDVIIIDTPPILVVPDARLIGRQADAVVYVVRWDQTTRTQVTEGLHSLATVDVKVSGIALNQIDMKQAQRYGGKYGEVYYAAYGSKYYNN